MNRVTLLLKNKRFLIVLLVMVFSFFGVLFVLSPDSFKPSKPPITSNEVPPVVVKAPELTLVSIEPPAGRRESIDSFTPTVFKFSTPVDVTLINISISPDIALKKTSFIDKPNTVLVGPEKTPWQDGVNYTITIKAGAFGLNGEVLKSDVVYSFSNTVPEFIDLQNPI